VGEVVEPGEEGDSGCHIDEGRDGGRGSLQFKRSYEE
jgi:hypothetical protein